MPGFPRPLLELLLPLLDELLPLLDELLPLLDELLPLLDELLPLLELLDPLLLAPLLDPLLPSFWETSVDANAVQAVSEPGYWRRKAWRASSVPLSRALWHACSARLSSLSFSAPAGLP